MLDKNPKSAIWPSLGVAGHSMSFYAVCALLVLSLVSRGTLAADAIALYGTFIAAAYLSPFLGSWLSLRLGLRLTVVLGATLAVIGLVATLLWRAAKTQSEGGRRFRLVAGLATVAVILYTLVSIFGIGATIATVAVFGTVAWIAQGFKKS